MPEFCLFGKAVSKQFDLMTQHELFYTNVSKDVMWETYLNKFPEGSNPKFRERTEHDCNCCKKFIRACGNVVAVIDNKLVSIWDVNVNGCYQVVADALSTLVKSANIQNVYRHFESNVGKEFSHEQLKDGPIHTWNHFNYTLPRKFVITDSVQNNKLLGDLRTNMEVFKRSLEELSIGSVEIILELMDQNSLPRGPEFRPAMEKLKASMEQYSEIEDQSKKEYYLWTKSLELGYGAKFKNSLIGELSSNISSGIPIDDAIAMYDEQAAPDNFKRSKGKATLKMQEDAYNTVVELGYEPSLHRRDATPSDITIENLTFADRSIKKSLGVFDAIDNDIIRKVPDLSKVEEVSIEDFIKSILPKSNAIEMLVENSHTHNFMSLVAPINPASKGIFKWNNNYSWAYNGDVTDSMSDRVKKAGGNADGVLRFTIQWNDGDNNQNDFDAHCHEPSGNLIDYRTKEQVHLSSAKLDVDIQKPGSKVAIENIIYTNLSKVEEGIHTFLVENFQHNGGTTGFTAEIEFDGRIYRYHYTHNLKNKEKVVVAKVKFSRENGFEIVESLPSAQEDKTVWGISTHNFHKVTMVMKSPNFWDGQEIGNKHWFFILDNCINPEQSRGFFNEYLCNDLVKHRKSFEMLGARLKAKKSESQLSGLGFSCTQRNHVFCKVSGSFNRIIKINF